MDGTGELFAPLLKEIPSNHRPLVLRYPTDQPLGYDELFDQVEHQIAGETSMVLLAESFSGPLGIRYAAKYPERVRALVLCVSFARFPVLWGVVPIARHFATTRPTDWMLRLVLAGWRATPELLQQVRRAIRLVDPRVIAHRFEQVARIDVRDDLRRCTCPILYLGAAHDRLVRSKRRREMELIQPTMLVRKILAPHLLLQTAPAEAWRCICEFITTHACQTAPAVSGPSPI
jgi:pimeloyl-ACP methyl ester carboxylesterase